MQVTEELVAERIGSSTVVGCAPFRVSSMSSLDQSPSFFAWLARVAGGRRLAATILVALVLPLLLSDGPRHPAVLGVPHIYGGDEPHYLVMLHSVVGDGDLDLRDEYEAARQGGPEAGATFAAHPLDHHTLWFAADGTRWPWYRVFEMPTPDDPPIEGLPAPPRKLPGVTVDFSDRAERSSHPAGLALLVAPFAAPFRGTRFVEPLALILTALVTAATAFFTRRLFRLFSRDDAVVDAATIVAVLGTPLWAYGRIFVTEPWLACCCAGALALALGSDAYALAGVLVAVGMQMKPPFALVALPLLADVALRRDVRRTLALGLPVGVGAALVLASNARFFGAPLRAAQAWESGSFSGGALGLLFSWDHGLFVFAPALVVALMGWPSLVRARPRRAWVLVATFLGYGALMALWRDWRGGYSYGPRLIVPLIPIVFAGLVPAIESSPARPAPLRRAMATLCGLSLVVSAVGAIASFTFWGTHPLVEPFRAFSR
jgi:hypothetical protein